MIFFSICVCRQSSYSLRDEPLSRLVKGFTEGTWIYSSLVTESRVFRTRACVHVCEREGDIQTDRQTGRCEYMLLKHSSFMTSAIETVSSTSPSQIKHPPHHNTPEALCQPSGQFKELPGAVTWEDKANVIEAFFLAATFETTVLL